MTPSPTITLFTRGPELHQPPASILASLAVHAAALGLFSFGLLYIPRVDTRIATEHYTVRHIDLRQADAPAPRAAHRIFYPGPQRVPAAAHPAHAHAGKPAALRLVTRAPRAQQTLLQPDLPQHLPATSIPVPQVVLWTPRRALVKHIVAPTPEAPTAADVRPSLEAPNAELNLADVAIASAPQPAPDQPILSATTSPLTIHAPDHAEMAPVNVAQTTQQPTPAALLSLSDLRMANGTVTLPPVNESAATASAGSLADGESANAAPPGMNRGAGADGPSGADDGAAAGQPQASPAGPAADNPLTATQITLPKNGQFGAVVVGNSLQDAFPELDSAWSGRLAYTVYLHVGLARSWILQYALPSAADAAVAGNIARLEAPWPYSIVRPNLAPQNLNADALMLRGFVNTAGRFVSLRVVFPPAFPQAQFVLDSLAQWQFRPATLNGQPTPVEILLIIPEELD